MTAEANANFHPVAGRSVFTERTDPAFIEYRQRWVSQPETFTPGDFPLHLDVESTGVCNLRCPFCATTTGTWGPTAPGYMSMPLYHEIIDQAAAGGACAIKLSFRGEPMLHPMLPQMIRYAKQKGLLDVYFNTNATLLTPYRIEWLIDTGLDRISISFEGTTKETYEQHRVGAKYETVLQNVRNLRAIRDKLGVTRPQIRVQAVATPEVQQDFETYVAFWREIADEVAYIDARQEGPEFDHRGKVSDWACPFLWQRFTILWDGTILPCCMHGVSDFSLLSLGSVGSISLKDAWTSLNARRYRALHQAGRAHELDACDHCSFRATELRKI